MKRRASKLQYLAFGLLAWVVGTRAFAGELKSTIRIEIDRELKQARAIVFSILPPAVGRLQDSTERRPVELAKKNDRGRTIASIMIRADDAASERVVTVIGTDTLGADVLTEVRSLGVSGQAAGALTAACTENLRESAYEKLPQLKPQALQELVEIRKKRRELLLQRLRSQLTPNVLDTLRAAETAYGLTKDPPLSADLPLNDLTWRLITIQSMAKNHLR